MKQRVLCLPFNADVTHVIMYEHEVKSETNDGTNPYWPHKAWPLTGDIPPGKGIRGAAVQLLAAVNGIVTDPDKWFCFYTDHRFEGDEKVVTYFCATALSDDAVKHARPSGLENILTGFMDEATVRGLAANNNYSLPHQMTWMFPMAATWLVYPETR